MKKENSEVVSATTQLKLLAPDGKKRLTDMLDHSGIIALGKQFPGKKANRFIEWFTYGDESIDGKSMLSKRKKEIRNKTPKYGCAKGQIYLSPDFDEPLDDFKEYIVMNLLLDTHLYL